MAESIGEKKVRLLLESGDISYRREYTFPDLKSAKGIPLRFDFAIYESVEDYDADRVFALIEFDGEQHFAQKFQTKQKFAIQQANDKKKNRYCAAKGIRLLRIPYTQYNSLTLEDILYGVGFFG